jgi:hypothetical protein
MKPKMTYDAQDDILMVWFSESDIYDAQMVGSTIMHVGPQGEPVLLEVLDASEFAGDLAATIQAGLAGAKAEQDAA